MLCCGRATSTARRVIQLFKLVDTRPFGSGFAIDLVLSVAPERARLLLKIVSRATCNIMIEPFAIRL